MRYKKEAPAGQTAQKGAKSNTGISYTQAPRLSIAAEIILLALQVPDHADRLRRAYWNRLEQVLQRHYEEVRAGT